MLGSREGGKKKAEAHLAVGLEGFDDIVRYSYRRGPGSCVLINISRQILKRKRKTYAFQTCEDWPASGLDELEPMICRLRWDR